VGRPCFFASVHGSLLCSAFYSAARARKITPSMNPLHAADSTASSRLSHPKSCCFMLSSCFWSACGWMLDCCRPQRGLLAPAPHAVLFHCWCANQSYCTVQAPPFPRRGERVFLRGCCFYVVAAVLAPSGLCPAWTSRALSVLCRFDGAQPRPMCVSLTKLHHESIGDVAESGPLDMRCRQPVFTVIVPGQCLQA
jgi:hypothetical protein